MRRFVISILFSIILLFSFYCGKAMAGTWEDEIRVTTDPLEQDSSKVVAAPDEALYAIWSDHQKQASLYMIKSTDQGKLWTTPSMILGPDLIYGFDVVADSTGLHLTFIWNDGLDNTYLYYTKSTDGGATFAAPVQVGGWMDIWRNEFFSGDHRLLIHAEDGLGGHFVYISMDGGSSWNEQKLLPGHDPDNPDFVMESGIIHVAFGGFKNYPITYSRSSDGGVTWDNPTPVSSGAGPHSQCPTLAVDGTAIHVAWEDDRASSFNVMYARSIDGGINWDPDVRINDTFYGARTKLLQDEEGLHIVWCQYHGSGWPSNWGSNDYGIIWYKFSGDSGATWSSEFRVSENGFIPPLEYPEKGANHADFSEYTNGFCVWWQDKRDGNIDIYLRNSLVDALAVDIREMSVATGGEAHFTLSAGKEQAGRNYLLLGGMSGIVPGTPLPGGMAILPLNWDLFTNMTVMYANTAVFKDFLGTLDGKGGGAATLVLLPPLQGVVGLDMFYAYALAKPWDFASNAVKITFVP